MYKILWIASCAPSKKAREAGGQTFHYYYSYFIKDDEFEIRLISLGDLNNKNELEKEFKGLNVDFIYSGGTGISKILKISNLESMLNPWNRHAGLISNYCASAVLKKAKKLKQSGFTPDIIILEWTNTVVMANEIRKIFPKSKMVASEHDVTYVGYQRKRDYYKGLRRLTWSIKYRNERRIELSSLKLCSLILPQNSDNIALLINEGLPNEKMQWLVPYFNNMSNCGRSSNKKDILFFGAMARPENYLSAIWFIENVMPLLNDIDIRFVVLGSKPPEELKKYENERIHITGFVDSVIPYFESSMCLVAPLVLGAGIKVKIIEALSSGMPVLTNKIGVEGIPVKDGEQYLHCETAEEYNRYIHMIKAGEIDEERLCQNARMFIKQRYSIEDSLIRYKKRLIDLEAE